MKKILLLLLMLSGQLYGYDLINDLNLQGILNSSDSKNIYFVKCRYTPKFDFTLYQGNEFFVDAELMGNFSLSKREYEENNSPVVKNNADAEFYRYWLRYSTMQFEIRAGLQKINFGPGQIFRTLQWFDEIDPRDPTEFTSGVNALLIRYFFLNNSNLWFWTILSDGNLKGREIVGSKKHSVEIGGRFQYPFSIGEMGVTVHYREIDDFYSFNSSNEFRGAVDGKFDLGIGLWFEAALFKREKDFLLGETVKMGLLGCDYTFDVGNGLHFLVEQFHYSLGERLLESNFDQNISALSLDYPLGLIDNISGIVYYENNQKDLYTFLSYSRVYDRFSFYVNVFVNPIYDFGLNDDETMLLDGNGLQLIIKYVF